MKQLKTVAKFSDPMRASIAKGMLESNGIEAEVFGEVSSYPSINAAEQNIKLKVNEADYESGVKPFGCFRQGAVKFFAEETAL